MAIPGWLVEKLVCPERRDLHLRVVAGAGVGPLNAKIAAGGVRDRGDRPLRDALDEVLVRWDGQLAYPVIDGIPRLCVDDGIDLGRLGVTLRR